MALSQMASCVFLTIVLLLNLGEICRANPSWDQQDVVVEQGKDTDLTIKCTINMGGDPFGVVRILRKVETAVTVITENEEVKEPFESMGRYQVSYSTDPNTQDTTSALIIQGVRGEDAGIYGCVSVDDYEKIAYLDVEVHVPIDEVYMVKISDATEIPAADGATVHLSADKVMGVGCVVKVDGGLEPPSVVMMVNGEDRTNLFTPLINSQKVEQDNGAETYYTEAKYTYVTKEPVAELNLKNLTCIATAQHFPSQYASVNLDVKYKPVITCPMYTIYSPKGESVSIKCVLRSNPGSMVTWSYGDSRDNAIEVNRAQPGNKMSIKESPFSEDTTDIELIIEKVSSKHFTNYYLTATNDIGITEVSITLMKGATITEPPKPNPPKNPVDQSPDNPKTDQVLGVNTAATITSVPCIFLAHLCLLLTLWSCHL